MAALAPCWAAPGEVGHAHAGGQVAGAEDDGHVVAHGPADGVQQSETLLHGEMRRLARGARHNQGAHAPAGEVFGVAGGGGQST